MRKVTAHYVYCGNDLPVKFGIVTLSNNAVVSVSPASDNLVEAASTEFYPGVLIPAIVNAASAANAWFPANDIDVQQRLAAPSRPPFAVITPEAMPNLSAAALAALYHSKVRIALGSTASVHPTALFRLMVQLAQKLPDVPFHEIVPMATANGAAALDQHHRGTIAQGCQPGIYHISAFCFAQKTIDQNSKIDVIID